MQVDDRPSIAHVGDQRVEVQPLSGEKKDVRAYSTLPVCVDKGVHTYVVGDDRSSVHVEARVFDRKFVGTAVRRFGAAMRMHKGKDGRVRQLCGPGIAPVLSGRAKKIHVKKEAPTSVGKKNKVAALQTICVWRRKEAPSTMSSSASC